MAATTVLERASLRVIDDRCTEPPGAPGFVENHGEHSLAYVREPRGIAAPARLALAV